MSALLTEFDVESAAIDWLAGLGWTVQHGFEIEPGERKVERTVVRAV